MAEKKNRGKEKIGNNYLPSRKSRKRGEKNQSSLKVADVQAKTVCLLRKPGGERGANKQEKREGEKTLSWDRRTASRHWQVKEAQKRQETEKGKEKLLRNQFLVRKKK